MRGLGVVYTPDEADAMIAGNTPPTETWRLNVFPVRELNGWSVVVGHRDVYHVVCMNAGIKRGARLAGLLTPRNIMLPSQPQLIIRRSSDTEASASWPSGLYTLMYLQALYQLADVYRLRGLQIDINHEFFIKGPPVWMQIADTHLTHFISVLHKYMWDQGRDDAHKRRPPLKAFDELFRGRRGGEDEEVALQQQFLAPVLGALDPAFPNRGATPAHPLVDVPPALQGRFARKAGAPMVPKAPAHSRPCCPHWRRPSSRCPSRRRQPLALSAPLAPLRPFTSLESSPRPARRNVIGKSKKPAGKRRRTGKRRRPDRKASKRNRLRKAQADRAAAEARSKAEAEAARHDAIEAELQRQHEAVLRQAAEARSKAEAEQRAKEEAERNRSKSSVDRNVRTRSVKPASGTMNMLQDRIVMCEASMQQRLRDAERVRQEQPHRSQHGGRLDRGGASRPIHPRGTACCLPTRSEGAPGTARQGALG